MVKPKFKEPKMVTAKVTVRFQVPVFNTHNDETIREEALIRVNEYVAAIEEAIGPDANPDTTWGDITYD